MFDSAGNRIAEYNQATGTLIREYILLNGAPVAVVEGGVIYYVRTDHIGRPVFATNAAGAKVWTASYLPFGEVRTSTGSAMTLRFSGQWFQSESGLHQNWMRDYDPTTGRYLQADPLGLVDGASVYGYVGHSLGFCDVLEAGCHNGNIKNPSRQTQPLLSIYDLVLRMSYNRKSPAISDATPTNRIEKSLVALPSTSPNTSRSAPWVTYHTELA